MIPYLRNRVISKFGKPVIGLGDCKELSALIFDETGESVNYNTLRRFFGLVKPTAPQAYTLDTLCKFLGYPDYREFVQALPYDFEWLQYFEAFNNEDQNIDQLLLHSPPSIIGLFLRELFILKRYTELIDALENPYFRVHLDDYDSLIIIGGLLGSAIRIVPVEADIRMKLCESTAFQEVVLCAFVDYGALNSYYGEFISNAIDLNSENTTFFKGVLNLKHFLNLEEMPFSPEELKITSTTHPILMSRIVANNLLWKHKSGKPMNSTVDDFAAFLNKNASNEMIAWHEVIMVALILDDLNLYGAIEEQIDATKIKALFHFHHYHQYLLFKAAHQIAQGELLQGAIQLSEVEEHKLRTSYLPLLRFCIYRSRYRIAQTTEEQEHAYSQLQAITKSLGHSFLTSQISPLSQ